MRYVSLLLLLLTGGCATGPSVQSRLAAYTGASAETLVHNFGVPDKQITVNGVQYLAYSEHHLELSGDASYSLVPFFGPYDGGGAYGGGFYAGGPYFGGLRPNLDEYSCETTFSLRDDKVFGYTLRGNDCG